MFSPEREQPFKHEEQGQVVQEQEKGTEEEDLHPVALVERLESAESPDEVRELLPRFFDVLERDIGAEVVEDVNEVYDEIEKKKLLVRLEHIRRIISALNDHKPFSVGGGGDYYANAVVSENEGVRIALAEGEAPGPIRFLMGFDVRTAIAFQKEDVTVSDITPDEFDLRNTLLRSALCRHVEGELRPEHIQYLVIRTPRELFPDNLLTEEEKKRKKEERAPVFRGVKIFQEALPLSVAEANTLQRELIQKSNLEPSEWIKQYAQRFRKEVSYDPVLRKTIRSDKEKAVAELEERLILSKKQKAA